MYLWQLELGRNLQLVQQGFNIDKNIGFLKKNVKFQLSKYFKFDFVPTKK
jgi:hypothetical protein